MRHGLGGAADGVDHVEVLEGELGWREGVTRQRRLHTLKHNKRGMTNLKDAFLDK